MLEATAGQILVNDMLPADLRDYRRILDGKTLKALLANVARKYPERYNEISFRLNQFGRRAAQDEGGMSFGLRHLRKSKAARETQQQLQARMQQLLDDDNIDDRSRESELVSLVQQASGPLQKAVFEEALREKNPLARQVQSGTRGKPMNLASLLSSDMLYADHRDQVIPIPVLRSYSEGLSPEEYWAGTYGARRGIIATKFATQQAGFLGKQLNQASHRLLISDEDREDADDPEQTVRGLPVDTDDADNEGALLAVDTGPFKKNTPLTPKILRYLKRMGNDKILVRSPIIGGSLAGGVYARDVGLREGGRLPGRGEFVGLQAAQSLAEPVSQGSLSAKHSGGVAGQEKVLGGFEYINQLIQIPKVMKGGAAHTTEDGRVSSIIEAPAGGWHVTVNGKKHYVGADNELSVKVGDEVEAGDVISDGMPNPAVITQYKGVGEGRRYFVDSLRKTMAASGITANRRNIELLARGLINHVRLTEETDDNVPDDIVPYSTLEHTYKPREGHFVGAPTAAVGQYLEKPVLHYTIGTKLRPSMLKNMEQFGVKSVVTHKDPPPFESEMVRGLYTLQNDPDWMTQMYGSGLQKSLLNSTARGATSDMRGTSFVPSLAVGTDFGQKDERQVVKPKADYSLPDVEIPDVDTLPEPPSLMPKMAEDMYHGSPVAGLSLLKPRASAAVDGESVVYGTPDRDMAVSFAAPWGDEEIQHGISDDVPYMKEQQEGAFKRRFENQPGSIYSVVADGFEPDTRLLPEERVKKDSAEVTREERIADLWAELQKTRFNLIPYQEKDAAVVVPASKENFSVNMQALQAARDRVNTAPTQAQREAGNYRKGHVTVNGLSIAIENPKGSTRSGVDAKGKAWSNVMSHDYGYIKGTQGSDGDPVDVFLGPDLDSEIVFIIDQDNNGGGVFDEHKCMVGFRNQKDAKAAYLSNYDSSWKGLQAITPMPFALFRVWCFSAATKKRAMTKKADSVTPLAPSVSKSLPKAPAASYPSLMAGNAAQPDATAATPPGHPAAAPPPMSLSPVAPPAPQPATTSPGASPPAASPAQLRADRIQQSRQPVAAPQPQSTPFGDIGAIKAQIATTLAQEANAFAPGIGGLLTYGAIASPKDLGTLFSSKSRGGSNALLQTPQTLAEMELPDSIGGHGRFSQPLSPTEQYEADPPPADMGPINDETDAELPTHHRNTLGINPMDPEGDLNMLPRSLISGTASSLLTPKPPVTPATGSYFSRIVQGAKNLGRAAVSPKAWAQGAKNVGRFAVNPETWLPGSTIARQALAGGAGTAGGGAAVGAAGTFLPALGGFTAVNAATELVDAAGLLPEAMGGDGLGNFGWDQQGFDQRTMEGGYKPVSNAVEGVMNPLKSIQAIGTGAVEGGAAVAGKARDIVTGTTAKSRAADADFEALKQTEQQRQVQLQQEIHSRQASRHDDPVVAQQIQELETQLADSVQRAEALHDETSTWKTGPGWLGGHSYRDNMQRSHDGLSASIEQLMKQKKEGTLPPEDVSRLTRLVSRKQNISQLLAQYNRDVGYTSQGDFDQTIRNRVWAKKQHLVALQQRLREPAVKVNPKLRAELAADMQATEEELGQYRRWATQPE